jgi:hypothetical protein
MRLAVDAEGRIAAFVSPSAPAAHSMDTDWYASDREGRVARFSSGEEGGVPVMACREAWDTLYGELVVARIAAAHHGGPLDHQTALATAHDRADDPVERALIAQILAGDEPSRAVYADWLEAQGRSRDPRDRAVYIVEPELRAIDPQTLPGVWSGVVAFASDEYLELFRSQHLDHAAASWRPVEDRLGLAHAISVVELHQYAFDDFWVAGAIAAAFVVERVVEPVAIGLYDYGCSFSGPYRRRAVPREPLMLADLPEPLRGRIAMLEIPRVSFNAALEIDPDLYVDCDHWRQ